MAYWRRTPRQMQAATDAVAVAPDLARVRKSRPSHPAPRMMRQYDLVERVRSYNPDTNEDLLNRAYVYAMKAHGTQTRASGDPVFSHPLEVAAILTDLKLDDATIVAAAACTTPSRTPRRRAPRSTHIFGHEIGALVEGLTKLKRLELVSREAKQAENLRKLPAGDRRRRPRAPDQARRPPAQHAHAGVRAARRRAAASPRRRWTSMRRSPAAWVCRRCGKSWRIFPSTRLIRKPMRW